MIACRPWLYLIIRQASWQSSCHYQVGVWPLLPHGILSLFWSFSLSMGGSKAYQMIAWRLPECKCLRKILGLMLKKEA